MKFRDWVPSMTIVTLLVIALMWMVTVGHCSVPSKKSNTTCWLPEGCVTQYQDNPFTYKAGAVTEVFEIGDREGMVLRIQPMGTYSLFTEDILLCGIPVDKFQGKGNPMVLTYRTKASRMVEGIGCHELLRVDSLVEEKINE